MIHSILEAYLSFINENYILIESYRILLLLLLEIQFQFFTFHAAFHLFSEYLDLLYGLVLTKMQLS